MKYPTGTKSKNHSKIIDYKNRGMSLESDLNLTNDYYKRIKKAYIYKKPTPIKITKVDYPSRNKAVIKEAYFEMPSTTDYNGVYKGQYIDFEAKETNNKTSFPLTNIHAHQIEHLNNILEEQGICFIIVRFKVLNKTFILSGKKLIDFINNNERVSIPLSYFEENGYLIKDKYEPRIDYLEFIDLMEVTNGYEKEK